MRFSSKIPKNTRLDRYLRKEMLQERKKEIHAIAELMRKGSELIAKELAKDFPDHAGIGKMRDDMTKLLQAQVVAQVTYREVKKICSDPARTGQAKELILTKLGVI